MRQRRHWAITACTASTAVVAALLTVPPLAVTSAQAVPASTVDAAAEVAGIETAGPIPTVPGSGPADPPRSRGVAVMPRGSVFSPETPLVYAPSLADVATVKARVVFLSGGRDNVVFVGDMRNGSMTIPSTLVEGGDYEVSVDKGSGAWVRIGTFNVASRSGGVGPMAEVGGITVSTVTGEASWGWTSESLAGIGLSASLTWGSGLTRSAGVPDGWRVGVNSGSPWSTLSERGPDFTALEVPGAPAVRRTRGSMVDVSYDYPYAAEGMVVQYRQADGRWRVIARTPDRAAELHLAVPAGPVDIRLGARSDTGAVLWSDAVRAKARPTAEQPDEPLATAGRNSVATADAAPAVVSLRGWDGSLLSFVRNDLGVYEQANGSGVPGYTNALTRESAGVWEFTDTQGAVTRFEGGRAVSVTAQGDLVSRMTWDRAGRIASVSNKSGRTMTFSYGGAGSCPDWTAHGFDSAPQGMLCRVDYPGGVATEIGYAGGYLALVKDPGDRGTTLGWDSRGRLVATRSALVSRVATGEESAKGVVARVEYDAQGRAAALIDQPAEAGAASARREIDFPTVTDSVLRRWATGTGEPVTSRVRLVGAAGYRMSLTYDLNPLAWSTVRVRDASGLSTSTTADPKTGQLARSVDAEGRAVRYEYDDRGLVVQIKGPFAGGGATRAAGDGIVTTTEYDTERVDGRDQAMSGLRAQVYAKPQFAGTASGEYWEAAPNEGGLSAAWQGRPTDFSAQAAGVWLPDSASDARGSEAGWQFQVRASTDAEVSFIVGGVVCGVGSPCVVRGLPKGPKAVTVQVAKAAPAGFFTVLAAPVGETPRVLPRAQVGPGYALATSQTSNDILAGKESETRYAFDDPAVGRPTQVVAGGGLTTAFAYESTPGARLLSRTTPGGLVQSTEYWPMDGTATLPAPCTGESITSGQPSTITRQDGTTVTKYYDIRGRVIAAVTGGETSCATYRADSSVESSEVYGPDGLIERTVSVEAVDGNPRVSSVTTTHGEAAPVSPGGSVTQTSRVDLLGRPVESTDMAGVVTRTTYDILGNPTRVVTTAPGGETLTFDYAYRSTDGLLQSQKVNGVTAATLAYDPQTSRLASVTYPDGVRTSYSYFGNGQVDGVTVTTPDARFTRIAHSLTRADAGRITAESLIVRGTAESRETRGYTYDASGRLTKAVITTGSARSTFDYGFGPQAASCASSYAAGKDNLRTSGARDGATFASCYDAGGRLVSTTDPALGGSAEMSYDARGRITGISGPRALAMTWSGATTLARLDEATPDGFVRTTLETYEGDILDKTVATETGSSTLRYGGPFLLAVVDGAVTGVGATQYGLAGGATVTVEAGTEAVLTLSGADGAELARVAVPSLGAGSAGDTGLAARFGPYGEPLVAPTSTSAIPDYSWRAGAMQETLPGFSSVTLMGARPYHPWLGQFLAPDPVLDAGNNLYSYTNADPINQRDASGGDSETLDWIARGLGIAGLLVGLGGAGFASKFLRAPGVINGQKAGITAFVAGTTAAVLGTAAMGVQIGAMVSQSGSISTDQWIVAITSGIGTLASIGGAVQGLKMYRQQNAVHRHRLAAYTTIKENMQGMDPTLVQDTLSRLDPATMTRKQMMNAVPEPVQKLTVISAKAQQGVRPLPAVSKEFGERFGGEMVKALKPGKSRGITTLAVIAED